MMEKIINKKIARYWDKRGETYSQSWESMAKKRLSELETDLIERVIKSRKKALRNERLKTLDIGIGTGRITRAVIRDNVEHYGTDISKTMVDYCQGKFRNNPKIRKLIVHDIVNPLPQSWGEFDVITAIRVLSYSPRWQEELYHLYQSMKLGGFLVFTFPNKYSSTFISRLRKRQIGGYEVSIKELEQALRKIGFSEWNIRGFTRLLDTFYDLCNSKLSTDILFAVEKILSWIFGKTLFVRLFYVTCKK
ncbi:MAG: class I SAM-dependent DNA methyltransferase [Patescibacteria group bacterium]